jgi:DNA (cytosine-5)-methyltransferase 1
MEGQTTIFEMLYPTYKINKKVRIIELFAGYGSQSLGLKYENIDFEHWKICEWAVKSIQAYKDIHFTEDNTDYSKELSTDEIKDYLFSKGISSNYNEPMTKEQINRLSEKQVRTIYNNIQATHNLVNIQQAKGKDLDIVDTDKYTYLMSYSFPCQDLSVAGVRKGMSDTSTRSGMLWEVERILTECKELGNLPEILLMENVPMIHSIENAEDFNRWQFRLEELGYKNYWQDLIATDYGIPQTRNRTFMVSILGDYNYTFPKPIPLETKLKDILDDDVAEKYYLSDKMINYVTSRMPTGDNKITTGINMGNRDSIEKAGTITTGEGGKPTSNFIIDGDDYYYDKEEGKILNKDYKKTNEVCDKLIANNEIKEHDTILTNFITRRDKENDLVRNNNITPTLTTSATEIGVCVKNNEPKIIDDRDVGLNGVNISDNCPTQRASRSGLKVLQNDLRIRRLTPKECFKLMGVKEEDFNNAKRNQSDASLYHLAGDSIVVDVLRALYREMI